MNYTKNAAGDYMCAFCDKTSTKQNTMFYHIQKNHVEEPQHPCDHCEMGFVQKSSWLRHLANKHPESPHPTGEINPYVDQRFCCGACDREPMRTKQGLYVHYVRTHCKEVPEWESGQGCSRCDKVYNSAGAYLYHVPKCFDIVVREGALARTLVHHEAADRVEAVVSAGSESEK
jgi:uncharacterized C2H2 Zn-finger protein